jgi:hypothetical protein
MRAIWDWIVRWHEEDVRHAVRVELLKLALYGSPDEVAYARRALGLSLVPCVPSPDRDVTQERSP